jgi:hypothetical protein
MRTRWFVALTCLPIGGIPAWCQNGYHEIRQASPELCGAPSRTIPVPQGLALNFDRNGEADPFLERNAKPVHLMYSFYQVQQVCPMADGRLIVFGDLGNGLSVYKLDARHSEPLDAFLPWVLVCLPIKDGLCFGSFIPDRRNCLPLTNTSFTIFPRPLSGTERWGCRFLTR